LPDGPELAWLFANALALVLPSIDRSEAFGLVLLQALRAGTPVIASDLPGVRGVASKEVGLIFPVKDHTRLAEALLQLAKNSELRHKLGAKAKEIAAEKYNEEHYALTLQQTLYEACVRNKNNET
jgi:glycosyltransferase involved in cell wall biosynthesis